MSEKLFLQTVGRTIRLRRLEKTLTQEELGGRAAICYKYLGEVERGKANPSLEVIYKIARALDMDVYEVLNASAEPPEKEFYIRKILGLLKGEEASALHCLLKVMEALMEFMNRRSDEIRHP